MCMLVLWVYFCAFASLSYYSLIIKSSLVLEFIDLGLIDLLQTRFRSFLWIYTIRKTEHCQPYPITCRFPTWRKTLNRSRAERSDSTGIMKCNVLHRFTPLTVSRSFNKKKGLCLKTHRAGSSSCINILSELLHNRRYNKSTGWPLQKKRAILQKREDNSAAKNTRPLVLMTVVRNSGANQCGENHKTNVLVHQKTERCWTNRNAFYQNRKKQNKRKKWTWETERDIRLQDEVKEERGKPELISPIFDESIHNWWINLTIEREKRKRERNIDVTQARVLVTFSSA